MLHLRVLRARQEVAAVSLAVVRLCVEVTVGIETLGAVGVLVVTGPLDAAAIPELFVGDPGVVAEASLEHSFQASKADSGSSHFMRGCPSLSLKSMRLA